MNKEIKIDLAQSSTTGFINYKGFINPNTGKTILYILALLAVLVLMFLTIKRRALLLEGSRQKTKIDSVEKREKKNNKKKISILVFTALGLLALTNTKANTKIFIITTKDNHGNKMANVEVKIYAKPILVEKSPYIVFDANGGEFLDGTTKMYFKLPNNICTAKEFYNSLTEDENIYLNENRHGATREGYYQAFGDHFDEVKDIAASDIFVNQFTQASNNGALKRETSNDSVVQANEETFESGQVIYVEWEKNDNAHVVTVNGNGAYRLAGNKKLYSYKMYKNELFDFGPIFYNKDGTNGIYVGFDDNRNCSNIPYGVRKNTALLEMSSSSDTYFACWNKKPDGIYMNDNLLSIGSKDNCFMDSITVSTENSIHLELRNTNVHAIGSNKLLLNNIGTDELSIAYEVNIREFPGIRWGDAKDSVMANARVDYYDINKVEFVYHGETISLLTGDDLELISSDTGITKSYKVTNSSKRETINNYFNNFYKSCKIEVVHDKKR